MSTTSATSQPKLVSTNVLAKRLEPFVCGGSAAVLASCCIHPIDLAKVRMQLYGAMNPGSKAPSFPTILRNMVTNDGFFSIYKGLDAAVGRQLVYGTARIGLHRTFSNQLETAMGTKDISFGLKALAGMGSGAIAVCIGTPFDIALVRLQADSMAPVSERRNYKNVFDALARTTREEGVGALYKGLLPNILRGMSMNVGMLACYDQAKGSVAQLTNDNPAKPSLVTKMGASCVAGFTAALFSLPFDLIKSRMMNQTKDIVTGKMPYANIGDCAVKIFKKEGPMGFFAGFSAYYTRCAPHAMIILMSIESITSSYNDAFCKD